MRGTACRTRPEATETPGHSGPEPHLRQEPSGRAHQEERPQSEVPFRRAGPLRPPREPGGLTAWPGFIERLPTTIFWSASAYLAGFVAVTLAIAWLGADPAGVLLAVNYIGAILFVPALYLSFAGLLSRSAMRVRAARPEGRPQ